MNWDDEDMALKLLHTADWHLGLRHRSFDAEHEQKLTRARLDAIDRILGEAESFNVDAVLCAGDLFDTATPDPEWWKGLLAKLKERDWTNRGEAREGRPRQMILLPGNHDPLSGPASVYHPEHPFRRQLPPWCHVVDQDNQQFALNEDAVLFASPCRGTAGSNDLALKLPPRDEDDKRLRIAMLHGQVEGYAGSTPNFPVSVEAAGAAGIDYLALGDHHEFKVVQQSPPPMAVYPGPPEPARMGEGLGHIAIVFFRRSGGTPMCESRQVGRWTWDRMTIESLDQLRTLRERDDLDQTVLRLKLALEVSVVDMDEVEAILDKLGGTQATHGKVGVLEVDRTDLRQLPPTPDIAKHLPEIFQKAIDRISASAADEEVRNRAILQLYQLLKDSPKYSSSDR